VAFSANLTIMVNYWHLLTLNFDLLVFWRLISSED